MTLPRPALGLAAGLLCTLSIAPFGWWPLAFVGIAVLCRALDGSTARQRLGVGFLFGLGLYVVSLWWMTQFSLPGGIFAGALQAAITAAALTVVHPGPGVPALLSVPAGLAAADAARSLWPYGGLPLGGLDLGQAAGPLAPLVTWGGRLSLVAVTAMFGAAIAGLAARHRRPAALLAATAIAMVVAAHVLPDGTRTTGSIELAIVQGGGPRGERASAENAARTYAAHLAATRDLVKKGVDLILWPEDVVDVEALATSSERAELSELARSKRAPLIAGIVEDAGPRRFRNYSQVFEADGTLGARFDKVRLVPYGEYFPLRSTIERFGFAELPGSDGIRGRRPGLIRTATTGPFAIAISYEGFFDDRARGGVRAGGRLLLIPTNASSYRTGHVPSQQVAAARLRALETRRWVAQASPTGFSAVIDSDGKVRRRTGLGDRAVIVARLPLREGLTPYARWNDLPALAFGAVMLAAAHLGHRRRRARASIGPETGMPEGG